MSRDMIKQTKWVCSQQRLRSTWAAWASAQSDQSLRCPAAWRKLESLATRWAQREDSDQTGRMPRLIWVFAGRTLILLVLSCRGSYVTRFISRMLLCSSIWFCLSSPYECYEIPHGYIPRTHIYKFAHEGRLYILLHHRETRTHWYMYI